MNIRFSHITYPTTEVCWSILRQLFDHAENLKTLSIEKYVDYSLNAISLFKENLEKMINFIWCYRE